MSRAMEQNQKKRVLMLTHRVPYPLDRGDRIRSFHILRHVAERFDVSLACTSDEPVTDAQQTVLGGMVSHLAIRRISPRAGKLRSLVSLACGKAATPAYFYRSDLARTIRQWHTQEPFDAVLTFCTGMIDYARQIVGDCERNHAPQPRHMIDLVDVDSVKWAGYAKQAHRPMRWLYAAEAKRLARIEAGAHDRFDAITVVSDAEAAAYREHVGHHANLSALRQAVDIDFFKPLADPDNQTLVFVGTLDYRPNVEGICWFVQHVLPQLRKRHRQVQLNIVGRSPCAAVQGLASQQGVRVIGPVADVRDWLAGASVVIAPLLLARGVQNKVLEAMASTRAVVCSPESAEGILARAGEHLSVAQNATQWVDAVSALLTDTAMRRQLALAARLQVETHYHWEACLTPLAELLTGVPGANDADIAPHRADSHSEFQDFAQAA